MKALREGRALSGDELATLVGCSENLIRRFEMGDRRPSADMLPRLAKALRTTSAFLTADEEPAESIPA